MTDVSGFIENVPKLVSLNAMDDISVPTGVFPLVSVLVMLTVYIDKDSDVADALQSLIGVYFILNDDCVDNINVDSKMEVSSDNTVCISDGYESVPKYIDSIFPEVVNAGVVSNATEVDEVKENFSENVSFNTMEEVSVSNEGYPLVSVLIILSVNIDKESNIVDALQDVIGVYIILKDNSVDRISVKSKDEVSSDDTVCSLDVVFTPKWVVSLLDEAENANVVTNSTGVGVFK